MSQDETRKNKRKIEQNKRKSQARDKLRVQKGKKAKHERWIRTKMWINYLGSMLEKDRGKIPDNIGNKILITNNLYVTKLYMSSIIQITNLGLETPVTLLGEITERLRDRGSKAVIDFTVKNVAFDVRLKESGLQSRINLWERSMKNENIADHEKEIAARCLYTVDVAREGRRLYKSRIFLTLRAVRGSELTQAEKIVYKYLSSIGAEYLQVTSNIKHMLEYISLISDYKDQSVKDVKSIINSDQTMAQMMPNSNSCNDTDGIYCGVNIQNNSIFKIQLEHITLARNIYVVSTSGVGKTVLAINMGASAIENGWAACFMDIKGNEFTSLIQGVGGYVVSLREFSQEYVNSYKMIKEDVTDDKADLYFKGNIAFSKKQLMILSGITNQDYLNELEELLEEFLDALYISIGALSTNRNTWYVTLDLNPYIVYQSLLEYLTPSMQLKYSHISKTLMMSLRMYMSPEGSKSYIFKTEFDYASILKNNAIMFDFGILESSQSSMDLTLFKLRFMFMQKLNAEFITYKHRIGKKVFKVLEESQVVDSDIMRCYVEEFTLRRSQGQTTLLLGNSVMALAENPLSKSLIENTNALFVGKLAPDARREVIQRFSLKEYEGILKLIGKNEEYSNTFLFINKMQVNALTPLVKVVLDKKTQYKMYTPVAQESNRVS